MNNYNPYFFNPNLNYMSPQMNRLNQLEQQAYQQNNMGQPMVGQQIQNQSLMTMMGQQMQNQTVMILQGKTVDSHEVVRAMDIPLDGSITYFPKADGSCIYTKQIMNDGKTSLKTYELVDIDGNSKTDIVKNNNLNNTDIDKIYNDISELKESVNNLINKIDDIHINVKEDYKKSTNARQKGV